MLRFYDADVVLFPVSSHLGTVWISTTERLTRWLPDASSMEEKLTVPNELQDENKVFALKGLDGSKPIHLGWLLLQTESIQGNSTEVQLIPSLAFVKRLVLVSDKLFHHLVNDHLEVRTSVSIDEITGAAKGGALFTYEAVPRGAVIGFEVAMDTRRGGGIPNGGIQKLLERAFATLKLLGVGGMGTRGFGRH